MNIFFFSKDEVSHCLI